MKIKRKELLKWLNEKKEELANDLAENVTYSTQGKLQAFNEIMEYVKSINQSTHYKFKYTEIVKYIGKIDGHHNKHAHIIERHHIGPSYEKSFKIKFFHNGYVSWFNESELEKVE